MTATAPALLCQSLAITVYGLPAPQGSKRHVGHGIMIESSKYVKPWREAVKYAALEHRPASPMAGALFVEMFFTLPKPKSAPKLRAFPDRKPDISKLVRSTEDALTDAGIWEDDARVVMLLTRKLYPGSHPRALAVPGVVILIKRADDQI